MAYSLLPSRITILKVSTATQTAYGVAYFTMYEALKEESDRSIRNSLEAMKKEVKRQEG